MTHAYSQRELSQEAKDKLALYLATKLPDELKTNLSSSRIYKDLWKEVRTYSVISGKLVHSWLTISSERAIPVGEEIFLASVPRPILQQQETLQQAHQIYSYGQPSEAATCTKCSW